MSTTSTPSDRERHLTDHEPLLAATAPIGYSLPDPDAVIGAPATYNTITKWALGIADTYVLTRLAEQVGRNIPITAGPYINVKFADHPTYQGSLAILKEWGVNIVIGPSEPGGTTGDKKLDKVGIERLEGPRTAVDDHRPAAGARGDVGELEGDESSATNRIRCGSTSRLPAPITIRSYRVVMTSPPGRLRGV